MSKEYVLPEPMIDKGEEKLLETTAKRYEKVLEPSLFKKAGSKVSDSLPEQIKQLPAQIVEKIPESIKEVPGKISEAELYKKCMEVIASSFSKMEKYAAASTLSESYVVKQINDTCEENDIESLDEICLARVDDITKLVNKFHKRNFGLAAAEGAATGSLGFAGIAPNLVLSTFINYRAVQSVALFYGYDVKNDPSELMIASDVFMSAIAPDHKGGDELGSTIAKFMMFTEMTVVKETSKKTWTAMASRGGVCLLITQMRALAHASARKALENAGKKGLEKNVFSNIFEQIGKRLTLPTTGKMVIGLGALIGAAFDAHMMDEIIEYADIFYSKRALVEKEARINELLGGEKFTVDADFEVVE